MINVIGIAVPIQLRAPSNSKTVSENNQPNPTKREMIAQHEKQANPMKPKKYKMRFLSEALSDVSIFQNTDKHQN